MRTRVEIVQDRLQRRLGRADGPGPVLADADPVVEGSSLTVARARDLLTDMLTSRSLDVAARRLKALSLIHI